MKLLVERDAAVKALARVTGVVNAKHSIPILCNIKLEVGATSLTLTANNLDQQAVDSVGAKVEQPGVVTVEAKRLLDVFKAFPPGGEVSLNISEADQRLIVRCGRSRYQLAMLPAEDFPQFPSLEHGAGGMIERDVLKRLFQRTRFACGNNETYIAQMAVYLHPRERAGAQWLTAVATDGKRLAMADAPMPPGFEPFAKALIPTQAVDEFMRLLGDAPEIIELRVTDSLVELRAGSCEVTSKLVDAEYYNYLPLIPTDYTVSLPLDVDLISACVHRILLVCDDKERSMRFGLSDGRLALSARADAGGCAVSEELDVDYSAGVFDLGFNARYMRDTLQAVSGETAVFMLADDPRAKVVLVQDSGDPDCRYLLMPHKGSH